MIRVGWLMIALLAWAVAGQWDPEPAGSVDDLSFGPVDAHAQRGRVDARAGIRHGELERRPANSQETHRRGLDVVLPVAERERPRPPAARSVEDDVEDTRARKHHTGDQAVAAHARPVGVLVERKRRVAGEAVLVVTSDDSRLDAGSRGE